MFFQVVRKTWDENIGCSPMAPAVGDIFFLELDQIPFALTSLSIE
jgi:hypothetical protein